MVSIKKAVEYLYNGKCAVVEHQPYENGSLTDYHDVEVLKDQPCRLSYSSSNAADSSGAAARVKQVIKLFLAPDVAIKPGSKITVTQNGVTQVYKNSGVPAVYANHQEITLELFEGWA